MFSSPAIVESLRRGAWLSPRRTAWLAAGLLLIEGLASLVVVLATHGAFGPMVQPVSSDFLSFYAAGHLANAGAPELAYQPTIHQVTEQTIIGDPRIPYYHFFYPPIFLPLCQALALLPYMPAQMLFLGVTALLYATALALILARDRRVLVFAAFPPMFIAAGLGQNSFLTAGLFGLATLVCDRRPVAAGIIWGLQSFKPHFLLAVPVALLAGRRWRALAGLILCVGTLIGLSWFAYGAACWEAFLKLAATAPQAFATDDIPASGLVSVYAAARLVDLPSLPAYGLQALAAIGACGVMARLWYRGARPAVRAASLIAAMALSVPVILYYDLLPLGIAIAWLMRDARHYGWRPWEKTILAGVWLLSGLTLFLSALAHLPVGPVPALMVLILAARRG